MSVENYINQYCSYIHEWDAVYEEYAKSVGLSYTGLIILYEIYEIENCTQKKLGEYCFIPKQTVNSAIRKLEQEGYLTLSNGKGHSKHILLTESGHTLLKETIFPIVEAENEAFTELSFEECNLLLKLHSKYTTALREKFSKL